MKRIRNLLFGLALLGSVGFGVASATAQPRELRETHVCPFTRTAPECNECCGAYGMSGNRSIGGCGCV